MPTDLPTPTDRLERLRAGLNARAAGWYRVAGDRLEQVAFTAAPDMPPEVADDFARATRSVALDRTELGIVKAALTAAVAVSRVEELPAETGSGFWLRKFGASRSVAVPLGEGNGPVARVVSLALGPPPPGDEETAAFIREAAERWTEP
jgi:hypothetical protein